MAALFQKLNLIRSSVCVNNAGLHAHTWILCYEK